MEADERLVAVDLGGLPQLEGWVNDGESFDPRTFLLSSVTVGEAAALSLLLWPEFTEYRGGVFLGFLFDRKAIDDWFGQLDGDVSRVEAIVNHIHLWDILAPKSDAEYRVLSSLSARVAAMWKAALATAFPGREFVVSLADEENDYGPTVSFCSV
ncbi:hypothetical protein ACWEIJ_45750 [Lentzea sp. NPDC004789]